MNAIHHYNDKHHSTRSADVLIPALFELFQPTSVLDVGCGIGHWMKAFVEHGIEDVWGIDGAHISSAMLQVPAERFILRDLATIHGLDVNRRFDLVICLEVAEHLPAEKASDLVGFLTKHSDHILFSAAIPYQTGENHFNEQPFGYWQNLFAAEGYVFVDIFRKRFWNDNRINWWYRQNLFLAVPANMAGRYGDIFDGNLYVHPELLHMYVKRVSYLEDSINSGQYRVLSRLKKMFSKILGK